MPPERRGIARDGVRMLVTDRNEGTHEHAHFFDLPKFVRAGDLLVVNDSATVPARLRATRGNGEILALHVSTMIDARLFMVEPRSPVTKSEELALDDGGRVTMLAPASPDSTRLWYALFDISLPMNAYLAKVGEPIRYQYVTQKFPLTDYQTIFARNPGSSEMPSAARPFTQRAVHELRQAGATFATITLHCGVSSLETPERPPIERFAIPHKTAMLVNDARSSGRRIIAVGTTVVRALESAVQQSQIVAASGFTDLVVEPDQKLAAVDALITGFHEPTATHISMLRAFASDDTLERAYDAATQAGYFEHEFGDIHAIF